MGTCHRAVSRSSAAVGFADLLPPALGDMIKPPRAARHNLADPLTLWTWSKVVRQVTLAAEVPGFSTHTARHLCLTDLARMGWELHAIATFAGHRSTDSMLRYIHLSGRELSAKLNSSMAQIHAWRVSMLTGDAGGTAGGIPA